MPRITTAETTLKKTAPRKRVARPRAEVGAATATSRPRRTTARTTRPRAEEPSTRGVAPARTRRAPTTIRTDTTRASTKKIPSIFFIGLVFVCLVISGIGVGIGMSDPGQIDIVAVVNERNERIERGEVREGETATTSVANPIASSGRLRPATSIATPTPVSVVDTTQSEDTVATTSDTDSTEPEATVVPESPDESVVTDDTVESE